ncbi:MAG: hypothetical protein JST73_12790 [Actinobacteria bacterium]|nr:hypothetical protein [Actinomycetota bacterium]
MCTGPAVQVSDGFGTTTTWVELADATHAADQAIRSTIAVEAPGRVFIHAGVVGVDGRAVVLPGRSMAGKTTLVAALLRAGADYLSDEYAVIDPDGLVHAYPRRLSIRGESGRTQVPAESLGATVPTAPLPIGLVAALVFDPQGTWSVTHGDQATCATTLIENAVAARHRPAEVLATAGVVARASAFAHGTRGETADAVARLLDLARQEAR